MFLEAGGGNSMVSTPRLLNLCEDTCQFRVQSYIWMTLLLFCHGNCVFANDCSNLPVICMMLGEACLPCLDWSCCQHRSNTGARGSALPILKPRWMMFPLHQQTKITPAYKQPLLTTLSAASLVCYLSTASNGPLNNKE